MLDSLFDQVKRMIFNSPATQHQQGHDPDGLIDQIGGLFRGHQDQLQQQGYNQPQQPQGGFGNVRPASEDPLGDPADQFPAQPGPGYGQQTGYPAPNVQQQFPGIRPASEDPYGDPADQERR